MKNNNTIEGILGQLKYQSAGYYDNPFNKWSGIDLNIPDQKKYQEAIATVNNNYSKSINNLPAPITTLDSLKPSSQDYDLTKYARISQIDLDKNTTPYRVNDPYAINSVPDTPNKAVYGLPTIKVNSLNYNDNSLAKIPIDDKKQKDTQDIKNLQRADNINYGLRSGLNGLSSYANYVYNQHTLQENKKQTPFYTPVANQNNYNSALEGYYNQVGGALKDDISQKGYLDNSPYRDRPHNDIYSDNITMQGVSKPIIGISDTGERKIMYPGLNYKFDGASVIRESPLYESAGYYEEGGKTDDSYGQYDYSAYDMPKENELDTFKPIESRDDNGYNDESFFKNSADDYSDVNKFDFQLTGDVLGQWQEQQEQQKHDPSRIPWDVLLAAPEEEITQYPSDYPAIAQEYANQGRNRIYPIVDDLKSMGIIPSSVDTGTHNTNSKHYSGNAVDLGLNTSFGGDQKKMDDFIDNFAYYQARYPGLVLRDERNRPEGQSIWTGSHLHLEMQSGGKMSNMQTVGDIQFDSNSAKPVYDESMPDIPLFRRNPIKDNNGNPIYEINGNDGSKYKVIRQKDGSYNFATNYEINGHNNPMSYIADKYEQYPNTVYKKVMGSVSGINNYRNTLNADSQMEEKNTGYLDALKENFLSLPLLPNFGKAALKTIDGIVPFISKTAVIQNGFDASQFLSDILSSNKDSAYDKMNYHPYQEGGIVNIQTDQGLKQVNINSPEYQSWYNSGKLMGTNNTDTLLVPNINKYQSGGTNIQTLGNIKFDSNLGRQDNLGNMIVKDINTGKDFGVVRQEDGSYDFDKGKNNMINKIDNFYKKQINTKGYKDWLGIDSLDNVRYNKDVENTKFTLNPDFSKPTEYKRAENNSAIINYNTAVAEDNNFNFEDVMAHEMSHQKRSNLYFGLHSIHVDPDQFNTLLFPEEKITDIKDDKIKNYFNLNNIKDDHDNLLHETQADLDALRYHLNKQGILNNVYDEIKDPILIKKVLDAMDNHPDIKDQFTVQRIKRLIKRKDRINALNTFTDNSQIQNQDLS